METYPKIQTVYRRDPNNKFRTLLKGEFAKPEFSALRMISWLGHEKVDGMNIRISFFAGADEAFPVVVYGRTDRAELPEDLRIVCREAGERVSEYCAKERFFSKPVLVTIFGEGYGGKIQSMGKVYGPEKRFIAFDMAIDGQFLPFNEASGILTSAGVAVVPLLDTGYLEELVENVEEHRYQSRVTMELDPRPIEGLVMRPQADLYNRYGERVIAKIKTKDFMED